MGTYAISKKTEEDLANRFTYHAPRDNQVGRYYALRLGAKVLAVQIVEETPPCREQSLALTHLEEAVFWANAAIARNDKLPEKVDPWALVEAKKPEP